MNKQFIQTYTNTNKLENYEDKLKITIVSVY